MHFSQILRIFISITLAMLPSAGSASGIAMDQAVAMKNNGNQHVMVLIEFKQGKSYLPQGLTTSASNSQSVSKTEKDHREQYIQSKLNRSQNRKAASGRFVTPNLRSMSVTAEELIMLVEDKNIAVFENKFHRVSLATSVPVIFPSQASSSYSGAGQVVAVLDSGVAKTHAFIEGSVIAAAEACFSNNLSAGLLGGVSLCPGMAQSAIGPGAADACEQSIADCAHGTQMAGIIAGHMGAANGVAPSASIIAVQVFSKSTDEATCGDPSLTPCIGALSGDIISALEYIYSIRNSYSIAAVNLSLGAPQDTQGLCDSTEPAAYKEAISNLRSAGIAVITSAGNGSSNLVMDSPACLSDTIAVAASTDSDSPWAFNNRNATLDFFAPGVNIESSSLPPSSFASTTGTSAAAAHVSGAWAVMKSKNSTSAVDTVLKAFENTGTLITQGLVAKPRINLTAGLNALPEPLPANDDFCVPIVTPSAKIAIICL